MPFAILVILFGAHMKAIWNGMVIAESDDILLLEDDYFFPLASVKPEFLRLGRPGDVAAEGHSVITFNLEAGRNKCTDAVWYYDHPRYAPTGVLGRVAFRKEVRFED